MAGGLRDLIVTLPLLLFLQLISGACERGDGDGTMHRYERAEGSRAWNEWVWLEMLSVLSWFRYHQEVSARNLRTLYLGAVILQACCRRFDLLMNSIIPPDALGRRGQIGL